jgi:hypothetical protein
MTTPSMKSLGIKLAIASVLSLIVPIVFSLALRDGLSVTLGMVCFIVMICYGAGVGVFVKRFFRMKPIKNGAIVKILAIALIALYSVYWTWNQFAPSRFEMSKSSPSVFDEIWYMHDHTAFGYPGPFLFYMDSARDGHVPMILDWSSLFLDITFLLFMIFVFTGLASIIIRLISPNSPHNSLLATAIRPQVESESSPQRQG